MNHKLYYLLLFLICFSCTKQESSKIDKDNPLYSLSIFEGNYPRSFFFDQVRKEPMNPMKTGKKSLTDYMV
jgi:hypothetical protein